MLDAIRYWQENDKGGLEEDVKAIDSAITFIACEHDAPGVLSEKESLSLIAALSFLKKRLCLFEGREELQYMILGKSNKGQNEKKS